MSSWNGFKAKCGRKSEESLSMLPEVIKAVKSAKIETLLPLSCRVPCFLALHSNVQEKMQFPYFFKELIPQALIPLSIRNLILG